MKNNGSPHFYWVNIGLSSDEVLANNFLWAPQFGEHPVDPEDDSKGTRRLHHEHWSNVGEVKAGDIIFGNAARKILFVAVATRDAFAATRPSTRAFSKWNNSGFKVAVDIFPLPFPLPIDGEIYEAFQSRYNALCKPRIFNRNGAVFQGYMAALPDAAGVELFQLLGDTEASIVEASESVRTRPARKTSTLTRPATTAKEQAVREARVGQGYFRQELLKMWKGCAVTGVSNTDLLLASHAKPWSLSDDDERLDPYNGFLLSPNIDRSFDKGLISFDEAGKILISDALAAKDTAALGIHPSMKIALHPAHQKYLAAHRALFGF